MPDKNKTPLTQEEMDFIEEMRGKIKQRDAARSGLLAISPGNAVQLSSQVDKILEQSDTDTPGILKFKEVEREKEAERTKRLTKAMVAGGLTAASLGGGAAVPTTVAALRAALGSGTMGQILKEGAKYAGGKLLNFADHPYIKTLMTALSGTTAYHENPDDMGSIARAGVNAAATRLTGGLVGQEGVAKAGNFIVPPIMSVLSEIAGQKMEGDEKVDPMSPGMWLAYGSGALQLGAAGYANHLKNAYRQTPGYLRPIKVAELQKLLGEGKISKEEFNTFLTTMRNEAGGRWAEMAAAGGFEDAQDFDFFRDNATQLAKIRAMPSGNPKQYQAKSNAVMALVDEWNEKMGKVERTVVNTGEKYASMGLNPSLDEALNPGRKGAAAFAASEPIDIIPGPGGQFDFVPRSQVGNNPTMASTGMSSNAVINNDKVKLPPMLRDSFIQGAIDKAKNSANEVGKTDALSWASEVNHNPIAAEAFKEIAKNPKLQVGKWLPEEKRFIEDLIEMPDVRKFGETMADPENFRLFNKYFADSPKVMEYGRKQYVASLIDDIMTYKSPKPGSDASIFTPFATRLKETDGKDFNKFFGNNEAYEAAKDIAFCLERAERYLAKRPTDFSTKEMMFASVFSTMTGTKLAGVSSENAAPVSFGLVGVAQMGIKAFTQAPQFVTKILEDYPKAAKILRKYWENPQENGKYLRAFQQIVEGGMVQEPRSPEK